MAHKTERPTQKKQRDAAKEGRIFKSKDVVAAIVLALGMFVTTAVIDLREVMVEFARLASSGTTRDVNGYVLEWAKRFLSMAAPFVLLCAAAGALPTLVLSRFTLAVDAVKVDVGAVSPMKGLKRLFSWHAVKEGVKAVLYLAVCAITLRIFVDLYHDQIFGLFRVVPAALGHLWIGLTVRLILLFLFCALPVLVFDAAVEYFLYFNELKMDKQEIKQEYKDSEGDREIKAKRREIHHELLSEEVKSNVEQSGFILANPTHIAIGIYINLDVVPIPFVSVRETNARALAVIRHAESKGVPVVRDVALARSIYRRSPRRYSFVSHDDVDAVMRVLIWLKQVEATHRDGVPGSDEMP
jgi:type III secretion protein U